MDQLPIQGTLNFRAVAPYPARGGRLKQGALYRSGEFHDIGAPGLDGMRAIEVTTAFDLRSDTEKSRRASRLLTAEGFRVVTEPHDIRNGDLRAVLEDAQSTAEACATVMRSIYAALPIQFAAIYARYFREVGAGEGPMVIHCAAGKDRTGVAVALLLDLIGVSRDDVFEDYMKTDAVRDQLRQRFIGENGSLAFPAKNLRLVEPVITVDPSYLRAMFETIGENFGDTRRYAAECLGLGPQEIERLERRLVG